MGTQSRKLTGGCRPLYPRSGLPPRTPPRDPSSLITKNVVTESGRQMVQNAYPNIFTKYHSNGYFFSNTFFNKKYVFVEIHISLAFSATL